MEPRSIMLLMFASVVVATPALKRSPEPPVVNMPKMTIKNACDEFNRPENITGVSGYFTSPGYPANYPPNAHCTWVLSSDLPNGRVMLDFTAFDLIGTCNNQDCVRVRDGSTEAAPLLVALSGSYPPPGTPATVFSTQRSMFVQFVSNAGNADTGFAAKFSREIACGVYGPQVIVYRNGLDSPYYPYSYVNNMTCTWVTIGAIRPGEYYYVVRFTDFKAGQLAEDGSCSQAWLDIPHKLRTIRLCGSQTGLRVAIPGDSDFFYFHSDYNIIPLNNDRFHAEFDQYTTAPNVSACGPDQPDWATSYTGTFRSANYPLTYPNDMRCAFSIISNDPKGAITLDFNDFITEENFDFVRVYDGPNEGADLLVVISGLYGLGNMPHAVHSTGPHMFVTFITDAVQGRMGFEAKYTADTACGLYKPRKAYECNGNITSPYYPQYWGNNMNCMWQMLVPDGNVLQLKFHEFNIGTQNADLTCDRALVHVAEAGTIVATHCGDKVPMAWNSTASYVTLNFLSDAPARSPTGEGFVIEYELVGPACPSNATTH